MQDRAGVHAQAECVFCEDTTPAEACVKYREDLAEARIAVHTHESDGVRVRRLQVELTEAGSEAAPLHDAVARAYDDLRHMPSRTSADGTRILEMVMENLLSAYHGNRPNGTSKHTGNKTQAHKFMDRLETAERDVRRATARCARTRDLLADAAWALERLTRDPEHKKRAHPAATHAARLVGARTLRELRDALADDLTLATTFLDEYESMRSALEDIEFYEDFHPDQPNHHAFHAVMVEIPDLANRALSRIREREHEEEDALEPGAQREAPATEDELSGSTRVPNPKDLP